MTTRERAVLVECARARYSPADFAEWRSGANEMNAAPGVQLVLL